MQRVFEVLAGVGLLLLLAPPIAYWSGVPDYVPTNFDFSGKPTTWGNKSTVWLLPVLGVVFFLALSVVTFLLPYGRYPAKSSEGKQRQIALTGILVTAVKAELVLIFAYIEWRIIQVANSVATGLGETFVPFIIGLSIVTLALYLVPLMMFRKT